MVKSKHSGPSRCVTAPRAAACPEPARIRTYHGFRASKPRQSTHRTARNQVEMIMEIDLWRPLVRSPRVDGLNACGSPRTNRAIRAPIRAEVMKSHLISVGWSRGAKWARPQPRDPVRGRGVGWEHGGPGNLHAIRPDVPLAGGRHFRSVAAIMEVTAAGHGVTSPKAWPRVTCMS